MNTIAPSLAFSKGHKNCTFSVFFEKKSIFNKDYPPPPLAPLGWRHKKSDDKFT